MDIIGHGFGLEIARINYNANYFHDMIRRWFRVQLENGWDTVGHGGNMVSIKVGQGCDIARK